MENKFLLLESKFIRRDFMTEKQFYPIWLKSCFYVYCRITFSLIIYIIEKVFAKKSKNQHRLLHNRTGIFLIYEKKCKKKKNTATITKIRDSIT